MEPRNDNLQFDDAAFNKLFNEISACEKANEDIAREAREDKDTIVYTQKKIYSLLVKTFLEKLKTIVDDSYYDDKGNTIKIIGKEMPQTIREYRGYLSKMNPENRISTFQAIYKCSTAGIASKSKNPLVIYLNGKMKKLMDDLHIIYGNKPIYENNTALFKTDCKNFIKSLEILDTALTCTGKLPSDDYTAVIRNPNSSFYPL